MSIALELVDPTVSCSTEIHAPSHRNHNNLDGNKDLKKIFRVAFISASTINLAFTSLARAYMHLVSLKVAHHTVSQSELGPAVR